MKTIVDELIERGVSRDNIIYIDLDKRGYKNIKKSNELEEVIDKYSNIDGKKYLFIDEIQNVEGFEEVINGYRSEGGWSIFITGSNSYLLSGELVTKLTGRYIEYEIFPLNFYEYIQMKKYYKINIKNNIVDEFNDFVMFGGFPRTIFIDAINDKQTYIKNIIDEIFEKDIRKRVKIRNKDIFENVRHYIINNYGSLVSVANICDSLRKNGIIITQATVSNYIKCLSDAKIIYECDRFDMKSKKSLSGEKKYYIADLGFYFSQNTDNRINYGQALENIVYFYAKSHNYAISVGRIGKLECDFILRSFDNNYSYVQVAYTILASKETEDREYKSLEEIKDNYPKYVVTTDSLLQKRNGIIHANIIDFMIGNKDF